MRTLLLLVAVTVLLIAHHRAEHALEITPSATATVDSSSYFAETPIDVTADEYRLAYDANEVAADSGYLYRIVNLTGTVQAIKSAAGVPYLVLRTAGDPEGVHARFNAQCNKRLAQIARGDSVVVQCRGAARANGVPTLHNCTLTKDRRPTDADHVMVWSMGWE